jgi:osmotically-inducible protein OsmY
MIVYLLAALAGAALMYLFDPDMGTRRRALLRDRTSGTVNRTVRTAGRAQRAASAELYGIGQKLTHLREEQEVAPDDATLAQKVMSELFRDRDVPKGNINVNAEHGVVYLRGQVGRPEDIERIESKVRAIAGVGDVENLLHLPGTPAPQI